MGLIVPCRLNGRGNTRDLDLHFKTVEADSGNQPDKRKARKVMEEITIRALGGLLARLLADLIRKLIDWPDS